MDGSVAIETNRAALVRIVAMLAAMAGLAERPTSPLWGGRREASGGGCGPATATTITRHLWRTILRLLRPAEAAARRLIIAAARGGHSDAPSTAFHAVPVPRFAGEDQRRRRRHDLHPPPFTGEGDRRGGGGGTELRPTPRRLSLPLFDPLRRTFRPPHRVPERDLPRICVPGWTVRRPVPPPPPPPSPDDLVSAAGVARRIAALTAALEDLPRQARRFARLKARLDAKTLQDRNVPDRPHRISALRGGPPPGGRLAVWDPSVPKGKNIREVDVILAHAHALALYALESPDTS